MSTLIIVGSARRHGNTYQAASQLQKTLGADLLDLLDYKIGGFRYDQDYPASDQFIELVEKHLLKYDHIVLASPVYWYSMSANMKIFFDRISDLLVSKKELGRQLRGKSMSVISCSSDHEVYESFFLPFRLSADYLGMNYLQEWHCWLDDNSGIQIKEIS